MTYDILVSGCIASGGARKLAKQHMQKLLERYSESYIRKALERKDPEPVLPALKGIKSIRPIAEGGIYAALWESAKELDCGLRVQLYDIPVFQDTIEICNTLDADPYTIGSVGQFLIYAENGLSALEELRAAGYTDAQLIGHTSQDKKRLIIYGEVERFLTPPERG